MPKIIENLKSRLEAEAWKQVQQQGYSATTIRSIAAACGVGVGTVYNYFSSKDMLLASCMLTDWTHCMHIAASVSEASDNPLPVVRCIYEQLQQFTQRHQCIFQDETAIANFTGALKHYHGLLRSQISQPLRKFCRDDFTADFIAEAILTWTLAQTPFEELYDLIHRLF